MVRLVNRFSRLMTQRHRLMQGCAFWEFRLYCCPFRGSNSPKPEFGGTNRHFQTKRAKIQTFIFLKLLYCINCNQILHGDKTPSTLHGSPNMPKQIHDGRWLPSWKICYIATSLQRIDRFWWSLARWCISALWTPPVIKFENFWNPKWILKNKKLWYLKNRLTNFEEIWHSDANWSPRTASVNKNK